PPRSAARPPSLALLPPRRRRRLPCSCDRLMRRSDDLDRPCRVIGDREDVEELDLGLHAVALDDALAPRPRVKRVGVSARAPLVDAAGNAALAPDEMLA